jgi:CIC family chloride channel protein
MFVKAETTVKPSWIARLGIRIPPDIAFMGTALLVGLGTGVGAVAFRYLIRYFEYIGFSWFPRVLGEGNLSYVLIVPAVGGLIVGPLIYFFAREAKGHGVPEVMEAVALRGGRIRPIVAVIKSLASSISIGSGGSVGREGPIVQIGSALGSALGQRLRLSDDRIRNLVACGAAGGIAATFNAPIAGVIFALEIILGQFTVRFFSSVVVSAVAASVIGRAVFGNTPAFAIPMEYGVNSYWEFGFYVILGLLAAIIAVLYVRTLYWSEDRFDAWKGVPEWFKPAVGGVLLGVLALVYPGLTGVTWEGYEVIEAALANQLSLVVVGTLLVLKLLATSLTLGSGGSGGVFAPSLFMGAMLGTAFEFGLNSLFPGIAAPPGAYALVGMGALFAASAHAPITAVLILFELTGDYRIILPLMLTVVVATIISQIMLHGESIYSLKLTRRGIHLQHGRDVDVLQGVIVGEVMITDFDAIDFDVNLTELSEVFNRTHRHGLIVRDRQGDLWGMVTISDLDEAVDKQLPLETTLVSDIATDRAHLLTAAPQETIGDALMRMSSRGIGRLPVIDPNDQNKLIGLIRRADIIRAYNIALTKRSEIQQQTRRMQLHNTDGAEFVDLHLAEGDRAIGKSVSELSELIPKDCVLVSVRREGLTIIPRGTTQFQSGDQVTAFVRHKDVSSLHSCFRGAAEGLDTE